MAKVCRVQWDTIPNLLFRVVESSRKKKDATAIVTGGTSGIGKEILLGLLKAGFTVHVPVRTMAKGEALLDEIEKGGEARSRVRLYQCDLANEKQVAEFVEQFTKANARLDVLISKPTWGILALPDTTG